MNASMCARGAVAMAMALVALGCDRTEKKLERSTATTQTTLATASASGGAWVAVPAASGTEQATPPVAAAPESLASMLPDCPSAAEGAQTMIENVPGGVAVTVFAADDDGAREVQKRASRLRGFAGEGQQSGKRHATDGSGGGHGPCPVVLRRTTVTVADTASGVRIVVRAQRPEEVAWLRDETTWRAGELDALGPRATPRMTSCPTEVAGAKTEQDGDVVRITGATPAEVQEIRIRANRVVRQLAWFAGRSKPPAGVHPQLGECDVLLAAGGARTRDIPGGVEISPVVPRTAQRPATGATRARQ
jgi:hypothetical protein